MAKKPAKRNVTNATVTPVKKNEGELILYMGLTSGAMNTCEVCGGKTRKGMVRLYKGKLYCSKLCAISVIEKDEGQ